jgi:O-antigen/teichoic acid export membrane protein
MRGVPAHEMPTLDPGRGPRFDIAMKDLKQRALRGGLSKVCAQAINFALRLGSLVILARLLDPKDFGLVAMVTALTGVLNLFRDFGLSTASVQRTNITEEQISTLFWINLLVGAVLTCLALTSAPLIADFYHEPRLLWVTVALAGGFLFNATGVQHSALLQRKMRFTTLAAIETVALIASVALGICMAFAGFGYWALVGMTLATPVVYSASVWLAASWIPGMPRRGTGVGSMLRFGGTVTLNSVVVYAAYNLEKVLLGRFWGADALGIYGRAYQLINIPTESLNSGVGEVALSGLSRVKDDRQLLKSYFLKGYSLVVTLTLPITITCALFANDLVLVVLGPKWSEAAPIFRLLTPTILIYAMINPLWWLLVALGLVGRSLKVALVLAPLVMAGYIVGLSYGPQGVALAYSTVLTLWVIPHIAWCVHGTVVSLKDILVALSRPLLAAMISAALVGGLIYFCSESLSHFGRLLVGVPVLLIAYIGILFYGMGQKRFYLDLVHGLRKQSLPERGSLGAM